MTSLNLNDLKIELLNLYKATDDIYATINDAIRIGMLVERTKDSEEPITMDDVFDEFNNSLLYSAYCSITGINSLRFSHKERLNQLHQELGYYRCC